LRAKIPDRERAGEHTKKIKAKDNKVVMIKTIKEHKGKKAEVKK